MPGTDATLDTLQATDRTETGSPRPGLQERIVWPDVARGIGIVLVVAGHSLGGMISGGQIASGSPLDLLFFAIYTFHMPLFFVLSGMFLPSRLARGHEGVLRAALTRILYPYFVWGTIQLLTIVALGQSVNAPQQASLGLFVSMLWSPPSQYWFLYALFLYQIAAVLFDRYLTLTTMLFVALAARLLPELVSISPIVDAAARYWLFFAVAVRFAAFLTERGGASETARSSRAATLALLASAWAVAAVVSFRGGGYLTPWDLPAAFLGIALVFGVARWPGLPGTTLLAGLGRRTMPIFLTHVLIVAGTRIVFVSILKITDPYLILPLATAAGLLVPAILFDWADRRRLATALALR